jgi:hypothetical protein
MHNAKALAPTPGVWAFVFLDSRRFCATFSVPVGPGMEEHMSPGVASHVEALLNAYPIIVKDDGMPIEARAGYLVAVVRIDPRIAGLDYLPSRSLYAAILDGLKKRTPAESSSS